MARVALHCDTCDHELVSHCPTCRQRGLDERHAAAVARDEALATPGVAALEKILGVEVTIESDPDADEDGAFIARANPLVSSEEGGAAGYGPTPAEAVKYLRADLISELRAFLAEFEKEGA